MEEKHFYVYILSNKHNTVLYTGVTSNLQKRISEHQTKAVPGFTKKYNVDKLVYYEIYDDVISAISREKQIKAGSRQKKVELIEKENQLWTDLSVSL